MNQKIMNLKIIIIAKVKAIKEKFNSNVRLASDIEYVKEFANKGNARAMYLMAIYYNDCVVDIKEAKKWMKKSADAGDPLAKFRCDSSAYNFQLAADIKILAEKGDSYACYEMGRICEKGYNGSVNNEEAMEWYRKAKEFGNQQAEYVLLTKTIEKRSNYVKDYSKVDDIGKNNKKEVKNVIYDTNGNEIISVEPEDILKAVFAPRAGAARSVISKLFR